MVALAGRVVGDREFSHEMYGEGFYNYQLQISRLSDAYDVLPLTISERLLYDFNLTEGDLIRVEGQLRSYNKFTEGSNRLILTVFARDICRLEEGEEIKNPNQIFLEGFICKNPVYRETPFGREITDLLLAVNRSYNKSDYIPCIAWGRNAKFSAKLAVGDHIKGWGRIQSRRYQKKLLDGTVINRVAYEVSISKMERLSENGDIVSEEEDL
jgi:single-stranded DNA-binding protein